MRFTGRVKRLSEITSDAKHPINLDSRHRFVHWRLQHLHEFQYHPGVDFMWAQVQQHYAVLKLTNTLRKIGSFSLVFRHRKAETLSPMMADLPKERLSFQKNTFHIDMCGLYWPAFRDSTSIEREAMGSPFHVLDNPSRTPRIRPLSRHQFVCHGNTQIRRTLRNAVRNLARQRYQFSRKRD